tara:strand:+ start:229 stop:990 length:762 start_codon:yes stop_codon:yes gene_type:complete
MIQRTLSKIKKNIAIINITFFFIAALFFYLNQNKFDTYKTYVQYSFHERLILDNPSDSNFFNYGKIKYFLNDLDFNKKFYGITDLGIKDSPDKIGINIDYGINRIEFSFTSKKKNFTSIFIDNSDEKNAVKKNKEIINNFVEESLNKFHVKLLSNLKNEIKHKKNQLNQLIAVKANQLEDDNDFIKMDIIDKQHIIKKLYEFLEQSNNKLIIVNDYSNKFRRLYLNSEEYVISFLILILLFNFLIKNFDKIIK